MDTDLIQLIDKATRDNLRHSIPDAQRKTLLEACETLRASLESPMETTFRICFAPFQTTAVRLGIDMKFFDVTCGSHVTADKLGLKIGADPHLVVRIIRVLCGMGLYQEVAPHIYEISSAGTMFASTLPFASTVVCFSSHFEIFAKLPEYFESNGFQCPSDAYDGPLQYTQGEQIHHFEWLATKPKILAAFNATMKAAHMNRGVDWFDFFPVATKFQGVAPTESLLVDIGGGLGHQLIAFKQRYPDLAGRIILQDLPVVLGDIKELHPGIETMPHDFFKEQPTKGARAYFMRNVLHDWPDKQASLILKSIGDAMGPSSMLLIDENVLPESGVSLFSAQTDMFMMAMYSALERTESQFRNLLEVSGFEVVHVYDQPEGSAKVFEAVNSV